MSPARAGSRPGTPVPTVSPLLVRRLAALERGSVALLVLVLVGSGVWTLAYQVALATGLGSTPTLVVSLPLTAAAWYAVVPAFRLIVRGGVGSFWGAVLAALLVGLVVGLSGAYASDWSLLSMYLLFIAVVTFRSRGLFGKKSVLDV